MSEAVNRAVEMVKSLEAQGKPWLEIQAEVEKAHVKQGDFEPLYAGSDSARYRLRFVPRKEPDILSRNFDEELAHIGKEYSLVVQMRCTGYNLFKDTKQPDGLKQKIKKSLGATHRTKLLRVMYLDKYGIELEHPDSQEMPEVLEKIGSRLYNMSAK